MEARVLASGNPQAAVAAFASADSSNAAVIYERLESGGWKEVTLKQVPGAPSILGQSVAWVDPDNGRTFAASASPSGLILFTKSDDGLWAQRNLTAALPGAAAIAGDLRFLEDAAGGFHLVGFTNDDHAVRYSLQNGSERWTFRDITVADLAPLKQELPDFVDAMSLYATPWGGLNAAGVDAHGHVHAVWWAPGRTSWTSSDLTVATGTTTAFQAIVTAYATPWGGINIAGMGQDGHLHVVWWAPDQHDRWQDTDLTDLTGGPSLEYFTLTSYVTPWGGTNIAGITSSSKRLMQYWWAPGMTSWQVTDMSASVGLDTYWLVNAVHGESGADGSMNLFISTRMDDSSVHTRVGVFDVNVGSWKATEISTAAVKLEQQFSITPGYGYGYGYSNTKDYGATITGSNSASELQWLANYYAAIRAKLAPSAPQGSAYWYDPGYSANTHSDTGEWFTGPDGWWYDPDYYKDPPPGTTSPHSVDFVNYGAPAFAGAQSFSAGRELLNSMSSDIGLIYP